MSKGKKKIYLEDTPELPSLTVHEGWVLRHSKSDLAAQTWLPSAIGDARGSKIPSENLQIQQRTIGRPPEAAAGGQAGQTPAPLVPHARVWAHGLQRKVVCRLSLTIPNFHMSGVPGPGIIRQVYISVTAKQRSYQSVCRGPGRGRRSQNGERLPPGAGTEPHADAGFAASRWAAPPCQTQISAT